MGKPYFEVTVRLVENDEVLIESKQAIAARLSPEHVFGPASVSQSELLLAMARDVIAEVRRAPIDMMVVECVRGFAARLPVKVTRPKFFQCSKCQAVFIKQLGDEQACAQCGEQAIHPVEDGHEA